MSIAQVKYQTRYILTWTSFFISSYCQLNSVACHQVLREWSHQSLHWPSTHPESSSGLRPGMRYSVFRGFPRVRCFLEKIFEPNFLHLLLSRKVLKSLTETSAPSWPAAIFYQNMCFDCMYPPSLKSHIYWPPLSPFQSSSSELPERLPPRATVLIVPHIKLNSQRPRCAFFSANTIRVGRWIWWSHFFPVPQPNHVLITSLSLKKKKNQFSQLAF